MLSFGHAVYSGLGSFFAIHALNARRPRASSALPVSLIPLVAGVGFGMLFAAAAGLRDDEEGGHPFAMITLGVGELVAAMALMFPGFFGGEGGISGNRVVGQPFLGISFGPQIQLYYLIALYTFVCTALMFAFTRTPLGRMLNAVRDNPERVEFIGYDTQLRALLRLHGQRLLHGHLGRPGGAELRDRHGRSGGRHCAPAATCCSPSSAARPSSSAPSSARCCWCWHRACSCPSWTQGLAAVPGPGLHLHGDVRPRRHQPA